MGRWQPSIKQQGRIPPTVLRLARWTQWARWHQSRYLPAYAAAWSALGLGACSQYEIADPRAFVADYQAAIERNDSEAVHGMLTQHDQERLGVSGVNAQLLAGGREVRDVAKAAAQDSAVVRIEAEYTTPSGVPVSVVEERGVYRVEAAGSLPSHPISPRQSLKLLRDCLRRRDYGALLRILSASSAGALDDELNSLVEGLGDVKRLDVRVDGEVAEVIVPGGHRVRLRLCGEVWKVEDFE